jgi:ATP-dependent protease ClpP protease subunit
MRYLLLCLLVVLVPGSGRAADITVVSSATLTVHEIERGACSLTLRGQIETGDAQRLLGLLSSRFPLAHDETNPAICLDSPGGSLAEAVEIAKVLGDHFTATVVPSGAECLSACAVVFMGGTFGWYEYIFNLRVMHPEARIGFHAPALNIADGTYQADSVKLAFDVAVDAIARIAGDLDETYLTGAINRFPRSLLAAMLVHRGERYLWIDTIEKAGAWDIWVTTEQRPTLDHPTLTRSCKAAARWMSDSPKMRFDAEDWELVGEFGQVTGGGDKWRVEYGELFVVICDVERLDGGGLSLRLTRDDVDLGQLHLRPWMAFPPDMPLAALR